MRQINLNFYPNVSKPFNTVTEQNILIDSTEENEQEFRTNPELLKYFVQDKDNLELYFNFSSDDEVVTSEFIPERLYIYDNIAGGAIGNLTVNQTPAGVVGRQALTSDNGLGNNVGEVCT